MDTTRPIIAIVGPTASGKSDLAIKIAKKYGGEIVCADSRTIYKRMDIGTAKPSQNQDGIAHHCIDIVEPDQKYSAAQYKEAALAAINEIRKRGRIPIIAGGSGLYIDAVIYDYQFSKLGAARDTKNPRHQAEPQIRYQQRLPKNVCMIGLEIEKEVLDQRIETRIHKMLEAGFIDEVKTLIDRYGPNAPGLLAPGYKAFIEHTQGKCSVQLSVNKFVQNDKKLAKRQKTWFKRNPDIIWVTSVDSLEQVIKNFLSKFGTIVT